MPIPTYNDPTQGGLAPIQTNAVNQQANGGAMAPVSMSGSAGAGYQPVQSGASIAGQNQGGFFKNQDGSFNTGNAQLVLGGIQTIGSLWNSFQQQKMAKKTFKFNQDVYRTNLKNQTSTYNTALEDRIRARYATEGRSDQADAYIDKNKL